MKFSSKIIAICFLLGAQKAVQATNLSSDLVSEILSFNEAPVKVNSNGHDIVSPKAPVPPEAAAPGAVVVEDENH